MNTRTKYVLTLAFIVMLGVTAVGFAMAEDSAVGTLEVERDGFYVDGLVIASNVTPNSEISFDFRIYSRGEHAIAELGPSGGGVGIVVELYQSSKTPSGLGGGDGVVSYDQRAECTFSSGVWAYFPDNYAHLHDFEAPDMSSANYDQTFTGNWTVAKACLSGEWTLAVTAIDPESPDDGDTDFVTFWMNDYLEIELVESTFEFEAGTQGITNIAIVVPSSGYLTLNVISNFDWKVEVKGTDLTYLTNTIPVANIYQGDDGVTWNTLLTSYAALEGYGTQVPTTFVGPTDIDPDVCTIWLEAKIPAGAVAGTYTFTFYVQVLAA